MKRCFAIHNGCPLINADKVRDRSGQQMTFIRFDPPGPGFDGRIVLKRADGRYVAYPANQVGVTFVWEEE